ncbi:putative acid--thiol ligase [Helianthus annuus]|nr:putative acid--thiol ligase [Helianthus annuus]
MFHSYLVIKVLCFLVAVLAPNIPEMYELHFAVPMAGAVLCTLNIRHDSKMVSTLLKHSNAKLIFVDHQFIDVVKGAIEIMSKSPATVPQIVLIPDSGELPTLPKSNIVEYEALLAMGSLDFEIRRPIDECDPIALNYTSGTTSSPKGVVYSHRGAYLNSLAAVLLNEMRSMPVYLWWCLETQAKLKSRQGVTHLGLEEVDVKDPETMKSVAWDAKTIGEVMFRGNTVMNGYLNDISATREAFKDGWFRSGDLGVRHSDGYIELKDRSKDIIISGGENISTIEVESVLFQHPAVLEAAVVGRPDDHWGETPCAFVELKQGYKVKEDELIAYCRKNLPRYMAPRTVVFRELPKTSTGKTQKFVLREQAKAMGSLSSKGKSKL